jgi:hypothetical protein
MLQLTRVALAQRRLYYCSNERDYRISVGEVFFPKGESPCVSPIPPWA